MDKELEHEVNGILSLFQLGERNRFSTADFIEQWKEISPEYVARLEAPYGNGGQGQRRYYTVNNRVAAILGGCPEIQRDGWEKGPEGWGSPLVAVWEFILSQETKGRAKESDRAEVFFEGDITVTEVSRYERDAKARLRCIEIYGAICAACGLDFVERYGLHGKGFIHVHHIVPLAKIGERYQVDPENDLIPVCPNCHAMIHRGTRELTIDELKEIISTLL